jgi:hypothetical protein
MHVSGRVKIRGIEVMSFALAQRKSNRIDRKTGISSKMLYHEKEF